MYDEQKQNGLQWQLLFPNLWLVLDFILLQYHSWYVSLARSDHISSPLALHILYSITAVTRAYIAAVKKRHLRYQFSFFHFQKVEENYGENTWNYAHLRQLTGSVQPDITVNYQTDIWINYSRFNCIPYFLPLFDHFSPIFYPFHSGWVANTNQSLHATCCISISFLLEVLIKVILRNL